MSQEPLDTCTMNVRQHTTPSGYWHNGLIRDSIFTVVPWTGFAFDPNRHTERANFKISSTPYGYTTAARPMSFPQYLRWLAFGIAWIVVGVIIFTSTPDPKAWKRPESAAYAAVKWRLCGSATSGFGLVLAVLPLFAQKLCLRRDGKYVLSMSHRLSAGAYILVFGILVWLPIILVAYTPGLHVHSAPKIAYSISWFAMILVLEAILFLRFRGK